MRKEAALSDIEETKNPPIIPKSHQQVVEDSPLHVQMPERLKSDTDLAMAWYKSETLRFETYGRRRLKTDKQLKCLQSHFEENPVWDYMAKIRIAEEVDMTI